MDDTDVSTLQGQVQVCQDSVWGSICNVGWSTTDALVVCRELGFSTAGI